MFKDAEHLPLYSLGTQVLKLGEEQKSQGSVKGPVYSHFLYTSSRVILRGL